MSARTGIPSNRYQKGFLELQSESASGVCTIRPHFKDIIVADFHDIHLAGVLLRTCKQPSPDKCPDDSPFELRILDAVRNGFPVVDMQDPAAGSTPACRHYHAQDSNGK